MDLDVIMKEIEAANPVQVEALMDAVFARKRSLFPDWEIFYIALPKGNWEQREQMLKIILEVERKNQKSSEEQCETL